MQTTLEKTFAAEIAQLHETRTYKKANELQAPQAPRTRMDGRPVINLSSNNYLALANHPKVVAAAKLALDKFGLGTASVRFICGTMTCHLELERKIAQFIGCEASTTFISCWDANVGVMPTLCPTPEDAIFSDALNHASIIDAIRLSKAQRFIYKHRNLKELETMLNSPEAKKSRNRLIITDGVFSMEGDIADLPALKELATRHDALLVIDESHATGVLGATGRGTAEHFGVLGEGTLQISTLGKALGGACGGYVAGSQVVCDYLVQKARPQLFSNALPPAVCYGSMAAIDVLMGTATGSPSTGSPSTGSIGVPPVSGSTRVPPVSGGIGVPPVESDSGPALLARLRDNVAHFRAGMKDLGLKTLEGVTPIVPVMVGETATAIAMQKALLEQGVFVSGFGYPVVPKGEARLRCQVSAGHTRDDLNQCLAAFRTVAEKFPESCGKH
ncbi:MAG: 2-amino-3-ketobutyrate coenzyme A ligase [Phycisphaerae bacterium]|nr:2-amino-3-ketobutyrate coenzyme A ligase [Phycisphaerae bacterium]